MFEDKRMIRSIRVIAVIAAVLLTTGFGSIERLFAPDAKPWPRWEAHDPKTATKVDHSAWNDFLSEYLERNEAGVILVRYRAVSDSDRRALEAYLSRLSTVEVSRLSRNEQFAFWINLYNALTIDVVLDAFPVTSIKDIDLSSGLLSTGPWRAKIVKVEGVELSLNDIEHRILRPVWRDPRIHYLINCASIGCPDLQGRAVTAENAERLLEEGAVHYINDPRGVKIESGKISVSKIYDWFIEDFGGSEEAVLRHLLRFARPSLSEQIRTIGTISATHYDWSINSTTRSSP